MGLLSPWFLAGIAAVGLPLWLHLLRQFKRTPQPFSSLMFFERRIQSSIKQRRLRYLALLALRIALLVLLAIAFANPFVNRTSAATKRRELTLIAVDRSFSMRYGNRISQAKAEAHRIVSELPGRSLAQAIAVDSHVEALTQPEMNRNMLNAAIDAIQPTDQSSSFGEFSRALRVMDQTTGMRLHVHFITDAQQTSMPPTFTDLRLGPHTALDIHAVGQRNAPNWAVETITAPAKIYDSKQTRITATLASWQAPVRSSKISLVLDGKVVDSKDVAIPAFGRTQVEFVGVTIPYGFHRGEVRMEPHDDLPNDDSFAFSIERSDPRKILFLYTGNRSGDAFYYKAAIESSPASGLTVEAAPIERASNYEFTKYAFVVLNDPGTLDEAVARAICNYVSKGGSAFIAVGPNTVDAGKIALAGNSISGTSQTQGAGRIEDKDPALLGAGYFENVQFSHTPRIETKPNERVIARFADGSPLLVEQRAGEGRILIFASTLNNSRNDFPLHASFLPFIAQTGAYLSGTEDAPSSVAVGTPIALRHTQSQTTAADVIGPDGKHELSLADATRALSYDPPQEGFYQLQRANGRHLLLAVHADRRESDLTPAAPETLALWRNTGNVAVERESGAVEKQVVVQSFWRYALMAALIAALIESIFANRYLREERQTL